jgi:hypothetical protein
MIIREVYEAGMSAEWDTIPAFIESVHDKTGVSAEIIQYLLDVGAIDYKECIGAMHVGKRA